MCASVGNAFGVTLPYVLVFLLQDLLGKAHEVEVKKLKEEQKLDRALDAKFPTNYNAEVWSLYKLDMYA